MASARVSHGNTFQAKESPKCYRHHSRGCGRHDCAVGCFVGWGILWYGPNEQLNEFVSQLLTVCNAFEGPAFHASSSGLWKRVTSVRSPFILFSLSQPAFEITFGEITFEMSVSEIVECASRAISILCDTNRSNVIQFGFPQEPVCAPGHNGTFIMRPALP